jgi:hypothetical protein
MTEENVDIDQINDQYVGSEDIPVENKHKIFVLYFKGLDRIGAPYGMNELIKKAKELKLPIPSRQEIKLWKRKYTQ